MWAGVFGACEFCIEASYVFSNDRYLAEIDRVKAALRHIGGGKCAERGGLDRLARRGTGWGRFSLYSFLLQSLLSIYI